MPKPSRFKALTAATPASGARTASPSPLKAVGKSKDPNYVQLYAYVRKETHTGLKMKILGEGREISEVVQELLDGYIAGTLTVAPKRLPKPSTR